VPGRTNAVNGAPISSSRCFDILRPESAPSLRSATLLVELHDSLDDDISLVIRARFARSHSSRQRTITDYPVLQDPDFADRAAAAEERRSTKPRPTQWIVLCPLPAG
jgi:hypothetical protein